MGRKCARTASFRFGAGMGQPPETRRLRRYRQAHPAGARSIGQRADGLRKGRADCMKRALRAVFGLACVFCALAVAVAATDAAPSVTPAEHRRGEEQTFLTYPEWFLVHSPAEYATYVRDHTPSDFPFWGHIGQLWHSYGAVTRATR